MRRQVPFGRQRRGCGPGHHRRARKRVPDIALSAEPLLAGVPGRTKREAQGENVGVDN